MIEPILAHLGKHLSERFGVPRKQVAFIDREHLFNFLSRRELPLALPAVAYWLNEMSNNTERHFGSRVQGKFGLDMNQLQRYLTVPLSLSVGISLLSKTTSEHFLLAQAYWYMQVVSDQFVASYLVDDSTFDYTCWLKDFQSLTNSPSGKEGRDYDRGEFLVWEGGFTINCHLFYSEELPVIRKVFSTLSETLS